MAKPTQPAILQHLLHTTVALLLVISNLLSTNKVIDNIKIINVNVLVIFDYGISLTRWKWISRIRLSGLKFRMISDGRGR